MLSVRIYLLKVAVSIDTLQDGKYGYKTEYTARVFTEVIN